MNATPTDDSQASTGDRILFLLKTRGPLKTTDLAALLEITSEAARQQIQKLQVAQLIVGVSAPISGAGRPSLKWTLTETAQSKFPDSHSVLTLHLIESIEGIFGSEGVEKVIASMEATARHEYTQACSAASTLREKVEILVQIRERAGYMAQMEPLDDGWLLVENHCPICVAAKACQGFCRSELNLFRDVLGADAKVEREEHILAGARRCAYRITSVKRP